MSSFTDMEKELSTKEAHTNLQHPAYSYRWQFHYCGLNSSNPMEQKIYEHHYD